MTIEGMTPERWKLVEALYHAAQTRAPAEREAFLARKELFFVSDTRESYTVTITPGRTPDFGARNSSSTCARMCSW
jgi:hypothetical protein